MRAALDEISRWVSIGIMLYLAYGWKQLSIHELVYYSFISLWVLVSINVEERTNGK